MLSKWMNDFDFDKDKTRLKLLDINLWWFQSFALILDPGHLMTKISWLAWDVQCTVSGWRTSREWSPGCGQNGAGTMREEINLRSNMKFQSSPSIGKFFRHLWRTGYSGKSYLFRKCDFSRKCDFFKHFTQYQTFGSVFGFWL